MIYNAPSAGKPHSDFVGYICELRNKLSRGHISIFDCKSGDKEGRGLVENYVEEGGRYQVLCNEHSTIIHCTNLPVARDCMKDATMFCDECRTIAGEGDGS